MRMVRPNRRKGIEEVYGSKMDAIQPVKSVVVTHPAGMTKTATMRADRAAGGGGGGIISSRQTDARPQRSFVTENDYYITTNLPMTSTNVRNANGPQMMPAHIQSSPYNAMSSRRNNLANKASGRQPQMTKVPHFALAEGKVNNNVYNTLKPKESHRHAKANTQRSNYALNDCGDFSDKELMIPHVQDTNRRQHIHVHQMQMTPNMAMHHPPQHQLHQQQMSQISTGKPQHQHQHQQQHQHQHQQYQQQHLHPHPHPHQHPHQKHSRGHGQPNLPNKTHVSTADDDDEKEDDPEEFFKLIRQTVQTAVGNTITDAVNKNFRDLGHKIDRFSGELKQTNQQLDKLQEEVTSKVIYYGEENSRHFRYLCMKSEYDKMFYQHQSTMGNNPTPEMITASKSNITAAVSQAANLDSKQSQNLKHGSLKVSKNRTKMDPRSKFSDILKPPSSGSYHIPSKVQQHQKPTLKPRKTSSDQSMIVKSSEMGVHHVLGQIKRFCNQIQMNDMAAQGSKQSLPDLGDIMVPKKLSDNGLRDQGGMISARNIAGCQGDKKEEETELDTPLDSMDESDGMEVLFSSEFSSGSEDNMCGIKYTTGDITTRGPAIGMRNAANNGAGDGQ